jgi:hypothetical protein
MRMHVGAAQLASLRPERLALQRGCVTHRRRR